MDHTRALIAIYRNDDPRAAFGDLLEAMGSRDAARCGIWFNADRSVRAAWPAGATITAELIDTAFHVPNPEIFPVGSEFPQDAGRYPEAEALIVPLRTPEGLGEVCVIIAGAGKLGENLDGWEEIGGALARCAGRADALRVLEARNTELLTRVEETEALHTLGLAANRTLDPDEVLRLVARFTRTLLGADYVTVNTAETGRVHTIASVGLRDAKGATEDYRLGRRVVEAEKPLIIGPTHGDLRVEEFPFHQAEGMLAGLGIPLSLFGETFGSLIVGYRQPYTISPRDVRFALTLAGHAAVAIGNARLHERVEHRSRELEIAYDDLRAATQAKERFFASINHELRNPIGAVLGYLTLVLEAPPGALPDTERTFIEKALRGAGTLKELVNDLLDLSKIAAGKMEVNLQPCTVADIVSATLNTIEPLARDRQVPLSVEPLTALPILHTDPHRAQQILVNLLSNAVKFTGPDGVRIHAAALEGSDGGSSQSWIDVKVADTGPGISPEDQPRVFEEFEQVAGTKGGTGLGLPISRRLARLLGGDLLVESVLGQGSTFTLRLPAGAPSGANVPGQS